MSHRYRVVVADPDAASRRLIVDSVSRLPCYDVVAECVSGRDAVEAVRRHRPELLLLDVNMPELDGFGIVAAIHRDLPESAAPAVIFLTADDRHALKAFEFKAVDCIMRPFAGDRLRVALERAKVFVTHREVENVQLRLHGILRILNDLTDDTVHVEDGPGEEDVIRRIGIRTGDRWSVIQTSEIDWIGGAGVYAKIIVASDQYLLRSSLSELERRLDPRRFVRIHRSTIVNITRVSEIRLHGHGEYLLVLTDGTELKASRSYADRVRDAIDKLG